MERGAFPVGSGLEVLLYLLIGSCRVSLSQNASCGAFVSVLGVSPVVVEVGGATGLPPLTLLVDVQIHIW